MEKVINYLTGFFGGLMSVMMAILPVTILWYVLTGGDVWGMDVITNLTGLVNMSSKDVETHDAPLNGKQYLRGRCHPHRSHRRPARPLRGARTCPIDCGRGR